MAKRKATATTKRTRGADTKPRKKRTDSPCPPVNNSGNRKGEKCPLPKGAVAAIRSLRYRVPDTTPAPLAEIADEALDTVVKVMRGKVPYHEMTPRLKAAQIIRDEACGPIPKTVEHQGGITVNVVTGVPRTPNEPGAEDPKEAMAEMLEE